MKDWNAAPILSARNLTRRYGEHIGCRDVSFDLWPGEVLGIVGESGSGKSTLLNMLSGRMEPTATPPGVSGISTRCRKAKSAASCAPNSDSCTSAPRTACVCRSAPGRTSANG